MDASILNPDSLFVLDEKERDKKKNKKKKHYSPSTLSLFKHWHFHSRARHHFECYLSLKIGETWLLVSTSATINKILGSTFTIKV
jgi:hypothetical protein